MPGSPHQVSSVLSPLQVLPTVMRPVATPMDTTETATPLGQGAEIVSPRAGLHARPRGGLAQELEKVSPSSAAQNPVSVSWFLSRTCISCSEGEATTWSGGKRARTQTQLFPVSGVPPVPSRTECGRPERGSPCPNCTRSSWGPSRPHS